MTESRILHREKIAQLSPCAMRYMSASRIEPGYTHMDGAASVDCRRCHLVNRFRWTALIIMFHSDALGIRMQATQAVECH